MLSSLLLALPSVHQGGPHRCRATPTLPPIRLRDDLGALLRGLNFTGNGVELGVQRGLFTRSVLDGWRRCSTYVQVDVWRSLDNYSDIANVRNSEQMRRRREAEKVGREAVLRGFAKQVEQCADLTTACAQRYPESHFDFIYVDARHDYKGALDDLHTWWPKLRPGGVMAGHDYTEQSEPQGTTRGCEYRGKHDPQVQGMDWTLNYDGTRDATRRVVKGVRTLAMQLVIGASAAACAALVRI